MTGSSNLIVIVAVESIPKVPATGVDVNSSIVGAVSSMVSVDELALTIVAFPA